MKKITLQENSVRRASVAIALYAVRNESGKDRNLGDPIHEWVTEGRRSRNEERKKKGSKEVSYSSCGDLIHWLLYRLGNREKWINRDEHNGWKMSVNLSRLYWSNYFTKLNGKSKIEPNIGDIIYLQPNDHVCVLIEKKENSWITADYGQPYGKLVERQYKIEKGFILLDKRKIAGFIDVEKINVTELTEVPDDFAIYNDNPY